MHAQNTTITLPNGKQVHRLKNDGRITIYEHGPHRLKTQVALSPKQLEEWIDELETTTKFPSDLPDGKYKLLSIGPSDAFFMNAPDLVGKSFEKKGGEFYLKNLNYYFLDATFKPITK